jgi:hypothetical protein
LFGVLERQGQYKLPFGDDQGTADFWSKVYRTFKQTMIEANIEGAFQAVGPGFSARAESYPVLFHKEKLRVSARFREIWLLDVPMEKLSARSRNASFGWINQPE